MEKIIFDHTTMEVRYLISKDTPLNLLIEKIPSVYLPATKAPWVQLIEMIVAQQLSTKVAEVIWQRIQTIFAYQWIPQQVYETSENDFRRLGVSFAKIPYIKGIAKKMIDDPFFFETLQKLSNDDGIVQLCTLNGIGPWTAEMFLIYGFRRLNVMSYGDLGLRIAVTKLFRKKGPISRRTFKQLTQQWQPYASVASLFLWRAYEEKLI